MPGDLFVLAGVFGSGSTGWLHGKNRTSEIFLSEKMDKGPKIEFSTINQPITRVNRIEVVCLHSRTNVLFSRINTYCLFFQTNRKGGYEHYDLFLIIFFDFSGLGGLSRVAQNLFKASDAQKTLRTRLKTTTWFLGEDTWLKI